MPVYLDGVEAQYEDVPYGLRLKHGLYVGASGLQGVADQLRDLVARITGEETSRPVIAAQTLPITSGDGADRMQRRNGAIRADLNQRIDALELVNAMFQFERYVYVGIIVCWMAVFVASAGSTIYRNRLGAAEGTCMCTSAAGLAGILERGYDMVVSFAKHNGTTPVTPCARFRCCRAPVLSEIAKIA